MPAPSFFLSTSAFMAFNLLPDPPSFYQLNAGWRITEQDALIVEAITWRYDGPLGIPYGPSFEDEQHDYPGHIRDFGVGLAYQRFWWKGLYSTVHATPFVHRYVDEAGDLLQTGFMLFVVGRVGWHFRFLEDRLFVEPSIACTAWPIETNEPAAFAAAAEPWNGWFLAEPGLHLGWNF